MQFLKKVFLNTSTTGEAAANVPSGSNPTSPADGDVWYNGTNLNFRHGGVTTDLLAPPSSGTGFAARMFNGNNQSLPVGVATALEFTNVAFDSTGTQATTGTPGSFTCQSTGYYSINFTLGFPDGNSGLMAMYILVNNSFNINGDNGTIRQYPSPSTGFESILEMNTIAHLTSGDVVTFKAEPISFSAAVSSDQYTSAAIAKL